jgi:hypothetical protein
MQQAKIYLTFLTGSQSSPHHAKCLALAAGTRQCSSLLPSATLNAGVHQQRKGLHENIFFKTQDGMPWAALRHIEREGEKGQQEGKQGCRLSTYKAGRCKPP